MVWFIARDIEIETMAQTSVIYKFFNNNGIHTDD